MMLKFSNTKECKLASIEADEYIPLTVEFEQSHPSPLVYWRGGDGKSSLVEISLSKKSGVIRGITLTNFPSDKILKAEKSIVSSHHLEINGIPVFDLGQWLNIDNNYFSSRFVDEMNLKIVLQIGLDFIILNFKGDNDISIIKLVKNYNIIFGFCLDEELSVIEISNITIEKMKIIKRSLGFDC